MMTRFTLDDDNNINEYNIQLHYDISYGDAGRRGTGIIPERGWAYAHVTYMSFEGE
jgi:hypothetical protein